MKVCCSTEIWKQKSSNFSLKSHIFAIFYNKIIQSLTGRKLKWHQNEIHMTRQIVTSGGAVMRSDKNDDFGWSIAKSTNGSFQRDVPTVLHHKNLPIDEQVISIGDLTMFMKGRD